MAISLNGTTGVISGITDLPDAIIDTDMLAAGAVTATKLGTKSFVTYAIICDTKNSATDGGTATSGAYRTRDLNTEIVDPDNIVSIASNQFTLGAGDYLIKASAPAFACNRHHIRLYNATTIASVQEGQVAYSYASSNQPNNAFVSTRISLAASTTFEIQHRVESTRATVGFGVNNGFVDSIYTVVEIYKEA